MSPCEPIDRGIESDDGNKTYERIDAIHDEKRKMLDGRISDEHIRDKCRMDAREGDEIGSEEEKDKGYFFRVYSSIYDCYDSREGKSQERVVLLKAVGNTEEREVKRCKCDKIRLSLEER